MDARTELRVPNPGKDPPFYRDGARPFVQLWARKGRRTYEEQQALGSLCSVCHSDCDLALVRSFVPRSYLAGSIPEEVFRLSKVPEAQLAGMHEVQERSLLLSGLSEEGLAHAQTPLQESYLTSLDEDKCFV